MFGHWPAHGAAVSFIQLAGAGASSGRRSQRALVVRLARDHALSDVMRPRGDLDPQR